MSLKNNNVVINFTGLKNYPREVPFNPPEYYPEYFGKVVDKNNHIYREVRNTLYRLGLDCNNFNTKKWNPLKEIIQPGMTVFIKPNTVMHKHLEKKDVLSIIIHASILRPLLDYICIALKNEGRIIIGDSPLLMGNFDKAMETSHIGDLVEWYRNFTSIPIECFDLRTVRGVRTWLYGKWGRKKVAQDPRGYQFVNLADLSCFKNIDPKRLRVAVASYKNMYKHHSDGKHEYLIPKSLLTSDVIISIPKLKTHRRTGVTLALKNFMGIPAWKDTLPHFITGSVEEGGDQYIYPSLRKKLGTNLHDVVQSSKYIPVKFICALIKKIIWNSHMFFPFKDDIFEAMWYGNDTIWRTLFDLNRIVFFADKNGNICDTPQRKFFCLIDGIIAGEKDGPIAPDPVNSGVILGGFNPVAIDAVGATLMGFDIDKIPLINNAFVENNSTHPLFWGSKNDIRIIDGKEVLNLNEFSKIRNLHYEPHPNWKGHIELAQ